MKNLLLVCFLLVFGVCAYGQNQTRPPLLQDLAKEVDNYTVQYLILINQKGEVLLQKNKAGWHTLAMRSNKSQSVNEAMDSLASTVGLDITSLRLAGLYVYKFEGLADHKEVSFRTHYTARVKAGTLIQPADPDRAYRWLSVEEALARITFESLQIETAYILQHPEKVWGGTFLIRWKGGQFLGSRVLEKPYALTD